MNALLKFLNDNPTVISDTIDHVNSIDTAPLTGQQKAEAAAALVVQTAGAVAPQYAPEEKLAFLGLDALIKFVFNFKKSRAAQTEPTTVTQTPTPTPSAN